MPLYRPLESEIRSSWKSFTAKYPQRQRSRVLVGAGGVCNAYFCQIWSRPMEGILKVLCLIQVHPNNAPTTASPVNVPQRRTGTYGLTSGVITPPPAGNLKCPLDDGHIQLTGNGCGTPPQLTIFIKWRMELSTTISHLSLDAAHAQIWVTRLSEQSCSVPTMLWACQCLYRGWTPHTSTN